MLKDNELQEIFVTELCKTAGIDRSTIYANYEDVPVLANEVAAKIEMRLEEQPHSDGEFSWIFEYIKENREEFAKINHNLSNHQKNSRENQVTTFSPYWKDSPRSSSSPRILIP